MGEFIIPGSDTVSGAINGNRYSDTKIRVGVVYEEIVGENSGETTYTVMVSVGSHDVPVTCVRMSRFGGAHNYEEYNLRAYEDAAGTGLNKPYSQRAGDVVVIAFLDGSARKGVILGGIRHSSRTEKLTANKTPAYISRFNGIEKTISEEGALTYTYRGSTPASEASLKTIPTGIPILEAVDDPIAAGSTFGFNEDGNFCATDGDAQSIVVNKDKLGGGNIVLTSGSTTVTLAGGAGGQEVTIDTVGDVTISTVKNVDISGLDISLNANKAIAIESKLGVSITSAGSELLDLIITLIDELGAVKVVAPMGPCTSLNETPMWLKVVAVKLKITSMMG